jgi:hypothetical protein
MNAETPLLLQLYERWRTLTEQEREAIQTSNWTRLAELQAAKQQLQEDIMRVGQYAAGPGAPPLEPRLGRLGAELIALETENARALAEQRRRAQEAQLSLDQVSRNLHQLHRAYAHGREPAWQSYS